MEETACNPRTDPASGCLNPNFSNMTEDCLFLDIYAPKAALKSASQVPVVVWFYGGAYVFGSKTQFDPTDAALYNGEQIAISSDEPVIFIAGYVSKMIQIIGRNAHKMPVTIDLVPSAGSRVNTWKNMHNLMLVYWINEQS